MKTKWKPRNRKESMTSYVNKYTEPLFGNKNGLSYDLQFLGLPLGVATCTSKLTYESGPKALPLRKNASAGLELFFQRQL